MTEIVDIKEVARRTGLSARALRFYEARGLVEPVRTDSGRRAYGASELERIVRIVALKRAGLTLAQIGQALASRPPDLAKLVDARMAELFVRQQQIADALKRLASVGSRLQSGETLDVATLCALIRDSDAKDAPEAWTPEAAMRLIPEDRARAGVERMWAVLSRTDPNAFRRRSADLYARIEAALPLAPDSPRAQALLEQMQALTAPFAAIQSSEPEPAGAMPDDVPLAIARWNAEAQAPCPPEVWQFLFRGLREHERRSSGGQA
jgi:DNA-binding transcriptional MerR regulator